VKQILLLNSTIHSVIFITDLADCSPAYSQLTKLTLLSVCLSVDELNQQPVPLGRGRAVALMSAGLSYISFKFSFSKV